MNCCLKSSGASTAAQAQLAYGRGTSLLLAGRVSEAVAALRSAVAIRPEFFEAHVNLGNALRLCGDHVEALASFRWALELRPHFMDLCLNIGSTLSDLGRIDEAIATYRDAIGRRGGDPRLHCSLGSALCTAGRFAEAEGSFRAALALAPELAAARGGLASVYLRQGRAVLAQQWFRAALDLAPDDADSVHGLGEALKEQGTQGDHLACFRKAVALGPGRAGSFSGLVMNFLYEERVDAAELRDVHSRFAAKFEAPLVRGRRAHGNARDPERRLRIGYVSPDLRSHSVSFFIEPVLARHDRERFEVYCYFTGAQADAVTQRLRALADVWRDVADLTDERLAECIAADKIDVLVDLSGHTIGNRLLVFARKPAPLQLSWIGYPSATGVRAIDYFVADSCTSPSRATAANESAVLRLEPVFSCYRPPADAPQSVVERADPSQIVLGSFNNAAKLCDRTIGLWASVLRDLPAARLLLKTPKFDTADVRTATRQRFQGLGVDENRLELRGQSATQNELLATYAEVDIALDTFPYCGTTTTCEALWMGVPVVSRAGSSFASRVGASLLAAAGCGHWVAHDDNEFRNAVKTLAADPAQRIAFRQTSRERLRASPLLDETRLTAGFERALRWAWRRWCVGEALISGPI